jgi:uncharacterized caspase-like protein
MKKYAILIGNSQFPDETDKSKLPDLACPEKDVDGLSTVLASERGEFEVLSLKNQPSYQILRELQRKVKQADSADLLLIYYSGHGKPNKSGLLHLTTLDTVIVELETSAIPINRVYDILGTGKAKKIVIILDCCYSGAAGQGFKGIVDDQLQQLNNARGTYLVTASTELQVAHENAEEGLSLFTKHLIAGLETGEADKDGDGWVSMNELYDYVHAKVIAEKPTQQPTKHVKEERGGLLIAKSGQDSRKERAEKIRLRLLELEQQDEAIAEIKPEAVAIVRMETSKLSAQQLAKNQLLTDLLNRKLTLGQFVLQWERLSQKSQPEEEPETYWSKVLKTLKDWLVVLKTMKYWLVVLGVLIVTVVIEPVNRMLSLVVQNIQKPLVAESEPKAGVANKQKLVNETEKQKPLDIAADIAAEKVKTEQQTALAKQQAETAQQQAIKEAKDILKSDDKLKWSMAVTTLSQSPEPLLDAEARLLLGASYYAGGGVKQNYELACQWYRKAASAGSKQAGDNIQTICKKK